MSSLPLAMSRASEMDEIEGSLLPSAALAEGGDWTSHTPTATPITTFRYGDDGDDDDRREQEGRSQGFDEEMRVAPLFPQYEGKCDSRDAKEKAALETGKRKGKMAAEAEKDDIRRAARDIHAIGYHASRRVEEANRDASFVNKRRGVQIEKDNWFGRRSRVDARETTADARGVNPSGGYEVQEYDVSEYQPSDYEISEYKSVYDSIS